MVVAGTNIQRTLVVCLLLSCSYLVSQRQRLNLYTGTDPVLLVAPASVVSPSNKPMGPLMWGNTNHNRNHQTQYCYYASQAGSWMGNAWLPPHGWRLYLPHEMALVFGTTKRNILWAGDSTTRRTALTWYALLQEAAAFQQQQQQQQQQHNSDTSTTTIQKNKDYYYSIPQAHVASNRVVNVGKLNEDVECQRYPRRNINRPRICRPLPHAAEQYRETNFTALDTNNSTFPYEMWIIKVNCLGEVEFFLRNEWHNRKQYTARHDLVILGSGIWDIDMVEYCVYANRKRNRTQVVADVLQAAIAFQQKFSNKWVVWRTSGYSDWGEERAQETKRMNQQMIDIVHAHWEQYPPTFGEPHLILWDWGSAVEERSLGMDRIQGDNKAHYGFEARWAGIQMLTNLLVEHGYYAAAQQDAYE